MRALAFAAIVILAIGCKRRSEVLPDGAKDVTRRDSALDGARLREYRFAVGANQFVCESRVFDTIEAARAEARKKMAERPQEELKAEGAQFVRSGRSVWTLRNRELHWCMLITKVEDLESALAPVTRSFKKKYQESL